MFPASPKKKRKTELHQSDDNEDDDKPSCSKRRREDSQKSTFDSAEEKVLQPGQRDDERANRIRTIISRELEREMKLKEKQLELVDQRLEEAKNLLHRLRYAIVAEYYKKQEHPQTMIDVAATLNHQTGASGSTDVPPQVPLHPSIKKIIGKRPQSLAEIMRACPKREAAKNASYVLNTKTTAELREERRLQKIIRDKGIVIDHSKKHSIKTEPDQQKRALNQDKFKEIASRLQSLKSENSSSQSEVPSTHVLNKTRSSKKFKCHFVVGNTSKYIGKFEDHKSSDSNTTVSHKWLIYVQTKDTDIPIQKFVKKVRFFLHPSYRPNDVIDIHQPPFQVARRGWGEFPMRIQLYFHDVFQQKPLQLVHKLVLDTTKSGLHTLGSETVVEVWLRNEATSTICDQKVKVESELNSSISNTSTTTATTSTTTTTFAETKASGKPRKISFNIKETVDDNFIDFLNKIEESRTSICADIEKIEPTLLVNEPLEAQLSPIKKELLRSPLKLSPVKNTSSRLTPKNVTTNNEPHKVSPQTTLPKAIKAATSKLSAVINQNELEPKKETQDAKIIPNSGIQPRVFVTTAIFTPTTVVSTKSIANSTHNIKTTAPGRVFNNVSGTIILPVTKNQNLSQSNQVKFNIANNAVFQNKTIQVLNAQGQIKTVKMLVASSKATSITVASKLMTTVTSVSSKASTTIPSINTNSITSSQIHSIGQHRKIFNLCKSGITIAGTKSAHAETFSSASSSQQANNRNVNNFIRSTKALPPSTSKNIVFQKEGKLFIIDPMQMKLKQQRKNQVSLLKPQLKLPQQQLPQQSCLAHLQAVTADHDYTTPQSFLERNILSASCNDNLVKKFAPQADLDMREKKLSELKNRDFKKWQRIQFERKFIETKFLNIRSAVEYLLRHLPLIVDDENSAASAYSFIKTTSQEFQSLPAFKQRSCEWLRAKFISRILRNSKILKQLQENFWTTREVATFARFYAYTPPIKALQRQLEEKSDTTAIPGSKEHFTSLIKTEMKNEQLQMEYESLSSSDQIVNWLDSMKEHLQKTCNKFSKDDDVIIIDDDDDHKNCNETLTSKDIVTKRIYGSPLKFESTLNNQTFMPAPARLETAFQLVGEICNDISVRLSPEEIVPGIIHPSAQTVLAHVSQLFVERLLRQTIADQTLRQQKEHNSSSQLPNNSQERFVTFQDIRTTILQWSELDFLTNKNLGVTSCQNVKKE